MEMGRFYTNKTDVTTAIDFGLKITEGENTG